MSKIHGSLRLAVLPWQSTGVAHAVAVVVAAAVTDADLAVAVVDSRRGWAGLLCCWLWWGRKFCWWCG